ncbi:hypothetical protein H70357_24035 [Paenibacillus sp. FSL H7-0357]|uniref:5'-methylthioadenosine/adenosylhomocysteine nucleosidase n=1 Tax=Paenibacillus sp. FSL H7-0357 TaxID=1536774 RepID=UPI0004F88E0F|nr:5'-methylthioadenosine/adenosylhomocysteine nucleosidase [Paenibacillus sp. FSL H7-0357]AIQ19443.1 hypothetical protein H70357_24035 [Paenibacillus sp. FSL H7-0357]
MITGVIGPSDEEIEHLIKKCYIDSVYEKASLKFYSGFYGEAQVVLVICGVGKVNACIATQVLIDILEVTHIILTGAAGALGDSLKHGDVVISTAVAHHDLPQEILTEYHPWMKSIFIEADTAMVNECIRIAGEDQDHGNIYAGKMISGEEFIASSEKRKRLDSFGAMCVDMESASIAQTCYVNHIPFVVIRSISDHADEESVESFETHVESVSLNALCLVEKLLVSLHKPLI